MSSSLPIAVAETVIAQLNTAPAGKLTPGFTAVRHYRPQFDLAELKTLRVSVVPKGIEIATLGRRTNQHDISVDVALQQKVDASDPAALDALMALVQQIADFLRLQRIDLADGSSAMWIKTQNLPIYSPEHLEQHQTFTSVLTLWDAKVRYGRRERQPPTGEHVFSFDTGGGTQHITQSIETIGAYAADGQPPDFGGAIGVTHDSVEGVDITIPVYQFSETHYLHASVVTNDYKGALFYTTGKVNTAPFRGCQAGECLFLGASGSRRQQGQNPNDGDWEITFKFAASPNAVNLQIGDITVASKKGWEYLWVRYEDAEDDAASMLVKKPVAAYVEKVYEDADFSVLGLGN